ncbi:MAG: rhodanese-like domain-containing protein [Pseudomonadota bacterium]|nr:rhodanese-like domain-containing protein [Pseudomonadota bacterium]
MQKNILPVFALLFCLSAVTAPAQESIKNPLIDVKAFEAISQEALKLREQRRIDVKTFMEMAKDPNTIILDARSKGRYDMKHIKGAINLNIADFAERTLAEKIPSRETRILIYCNNNFINDSEAFMTKAMPVSLNIPTFINLYAYGYKNVYELGPAEDENSTVLEFESSLPMLDIKG